MTNRVRNKTLLAAFIGLGAAITACHFDRKAPAAADIVKSDIADLDALGYGAYVVDPERLKWEHKYDAYTDSMARVTEESFLRTSYLLDSVHAKALGHHLYDMTITMDEVRAKAGEDTKNYFENFAEFKQNKDKTGFVLRDHQEVKAAFHESVGILEFSVGNDDSPSTKKVLHRDFIAPRMRAQ